MTGTKIYVGQTTKQLVIGYPGAREGEQLYHYYPLKRDFKKQLKGVAYNLSIDKKIENAVFEKLENSALGVIPLLDFHISDLSKYYKEVKRDGKN